MTSARTCETCRFWAYGKRCRRFPPKVMKFSDGSGDYAEWPRVGANDWCGEHQQKEGEHDGEKYEAFDVTPLGRAVALILNERKEK